MVSGEHDAKPRTESIVIIIRVIGWVATHDLSVLVLIENIES